MSQLLLIGNLRTTEIIIIALVILLLFGAKKIPELMRGIGKGVKSFKDGLNEEDSSSNESEVSKQEQADKDKE